MHACKLEKLFVILLTSVLTSCVQHNSIQITQVDSTPEKEVKGSQKIHQNKSVISAEQSSNMRHSFRNMTIPFVKNLGQTDEKVQYYAKTFAGTIFVTDEGDLVYSLPEVSRDTPTPTITDKSVVFTERLVGAKSQVPVPSGRSETNISSFKGSSPDRWMSDLPSYNFISYKSVYPGVELKLIAHNNSVEKVFTIDPGADPYQIEVELTMVEKVQVSPEGFLNVLTEGGEVQFSRPLAWQQYGSERKNVDIAYVINPEKPGHYGFQLGEYDQNSPLWIDPLLQSTYLGGSSFETTRDIAIGPNGDVYVVGGTLSSDFPLCSASSGFCLYGADHKFVLEEAFVARMSPDLTYLKQTTYLGGDRWYC